MHPIVIYVLVKTRMEQDREAERRRLAQAEMPRMERASASRRSPRNRWPGAIRLYPWTRPPWRDHAQPSSDRRELPPAGRHGKPAPTGAAGELAGVSPGRVRDAEGELAGGCVLEPEHHVHQTCRLAS